MDILVLIWLFSLIMDLIILSIRCENTEALSFIDATLLGVFITLPLFNTIIIIIFLWAIIFDN